MPFLPLKHEGNDDTKCNTNDRPYMNMPIANTYVEYRCVAEVIIWMCKEDTR